MLHTKMNEVIRDVCETLAEREELVYTMALALLTGKICLFSGSRDRPNHRQLTCFVPVSKVRSNLTF